MYYTIESLYRESRYSSRRTRSRSKSPVVEVKEKIKKKVISEKKKSYIKDYSGQLLRRGVKIYIQCNLYITATYNAYSLIGPLRVGCYRQVTSVWSIVIAVYTVFVTL